jgi:hypothetical protein
MSPCMIISAAKKENRPSICHLGKVKDDPLYIFPDIPIY